MDPEESDYECADNCGQQSETQDNLNHSEQLLDEHSDEFLDGENCYYLPESDLEKEEVKLIIIRLG
jgi:hypothetical protein